MGIKEKDKIKIKLEWATVFTCEDELRAFIRAIGEVHAARYCARGVVEDALLENGRYLGSTNHIKVKRS